MQTSSVFDHSSNVQFINSSIAVNQSMDTSAVLRFLYEAVIKYAGSGHQDPSTCLEGTRKTALEEIDEWKRRNRQEQGSGLIWLTGSAGSGKTAIAQTVCEQFREEELFVVDCSFFRSTNCTNPKFLFLTIAYQLAVGNALLKASIEAVVHADPAVVNAPLDALLKRLILGPITKAGGQLPTIFIVLDGLDECEGETQQIQIIHLIQSVIKDKTLSIRFLVASRPEIWIRDAFSSPFAPSLSTVTLNQNSEADNDIRFFYKIEFTKIRKHPEHVQSFGSTPTPWPSDRELERLVEWASGQFIYAKTVTRFVGEPGHSPVRRLELVLQRLSQATKSGSPLGQLDALYSHILSCVADWNITSIVLGALSVTKGSPMQREMLSAIEVIHGLNPGDAFLALRNLHPVVFVPSDLTPERERMSDKQYAAVLDDESQHPRFYHKSFTDFLHNPRRAGKYFIDMEKSNEMMAIGCLKVLRSVTSSRLNRLFSLTWWYAHCCWHIACICSGFEGNKKLLNELNHFLFLSWHFLPYKLEDEERWDQLAPLRHLERWNNDALEGLRTIHETLRPVDLSYGVHYRASNMWYWIKTQSDVSLLDFPKLRLKLWILHMLANEREEL